MTPARPEALNGHVVHNYEQLMGMLAAARESQDLTFAEIGERADCHLQQAWSWINGEMECRARRLFALADALGYDLALIPRDDT